MSTVIGSGTSSGHSWLRLYAAVAVLPLALTACGGGGGGGSPTPPPPAPAPAPVPTPAPAPAPGEAGLNWTNVTAASAGNLLGVDYADGHYVAVSDQGSALASTDGATWSAITLLSSNVSTDHLKAYAITHLGSNFVAAGAVSPTPYTTSTGAVATSADGVTWTMGTLPAGATPIHGLIAGTRLIGLGETGHVYSSTNGQSWTALTAITGPSTLNAGVFANGKYVGVGDNGYIVASNDSIAWAAGQVVKIAGAGVNLHGIAWTGTQFVAVGDNGAITTSADGSAWSALHTSALSGALRSVAVSDTGLIVVVGDSGIETSTDGITWTSRDEAGAAALAGVTFANSKFVAVGTSSAIKTSVATN